MTSELSGQASGDDIFRRDVGLLEKGGNTAGARTPDIILSSSSLWYVISADLSKNLIFTDNKVEDQWRIAALENKDGIV